MKDLKSHVAGVYYNDQYKVYISRTTGKRPLYRGPDKELAEKARLDWNATRKVSRYASGYKTKDKYKGCFQPCWVNNLVQAPILIDGFDEQ